MLAYNQAIAELENHLHEDGYLSQPIGQSLVFKSEPNATVSISNGTVYSENNWIHWLDLGDLAPETGVMHILSN